MAAWPGVDTKEKFLIKRLQAVWEYRGFVLSSVKREFQARYQNSLLGTAWAILNPLTMILVYTLVFSQVMRNRLAGSDTVFGYSIYLCAGILPWGFFSDILMRGQGIFLEYGNMIKKLKFPRMCLPVIVILSASVNFLIIFVLFLTFLLVSGTFPGGAFFYIFPVLGLQIIFSIGLAVLFGVLNVFFRDVGQFCAVLMQLWFWFTPIVYPAQIVPEPLKDLWQLNPMYWFISTYQQILLFGNPPNWKYMLAAAVVSVALCVCAASLFHKRSGEMVDEL